MNELSVARKAARYDQAVEKAKNLLKVIGDTTLGNLVLKNEFENMFPELAESEDERIRKALIWGFKAMAQESETFANIPISSCIDYLEKQCEQKHTPKHKIGDTIYYNSFGEVKSMVVSDVVIDSTDDPMYEDKEGNAVFEKDIIEQKPTDKAEPKFKQGDIIKEKETGNLFYVNSIEDFGYTLHYKNCIAKGCTMDFKHEDNYELVEETHVWSEEDLRIIQSITDVLFRNGLQTQLNWMNTLKDRYAWKPSDEQLEALVSATENCAYSEYQDCLRGLIGQLKKLK